MLGFKVGRADLSSKHVRGVNVTIDKFAPGNFSAPTRNGREYCTGISHRSISVIGFRRRGSLSDLDRVTRGCFGRRRHIEVHGTAWPSRRSLRAAVVSFLWRMRFWQVFHTNVDGGNRCCLGHEFLRTQFLRRWVRVWHHRLIAPRHTAQHIIHSDSNFIVQQACAFQRILIAMYAYHQLSGIEITIKDQVTTPNSVKLIPTSSHREH